LDDVDVLAALALAEGGFASFAELVAFAIGF